MALEALASVGPAAKRAGPVLRRLLRDRTGPDIRALIALARTQGAEAVPDLIGALRTPRIRYCALDALAEIGPGARAALPALQELAQSKEKELQEAATETLERIQKDG
jgi:HEAT repeat protein